MSGTRTNNRPEIALLTGGGDRPYALGLAQSLIDQGMYFDFVGSDDLETPALCESPQVRFLNLRGDQRPQAPALEKARRLAAYYVRLLIYAARSKAPIFHLLWNNKFELFDRTLLQLFYRLRGKRVVLTIHNVNKAVRDGADTVLNRVTLRIQYGLSNHMFVHTKEMRDELHRDFGVPLSRISVIPFGINSTVPDTELSGAEARRRLGLAPADKVVLFFGNIAPYKGVEYLVDAFSMIAGEMPDCRLVIAGRPKGSEAYWAGIENEIVARGLGDRICRRIEYVADEETEVFFKAADVLALPYVHVFQSGVLFLAYNFGLPVVATDIGSLKNDVVEGTTGFVCQPKDAGSLASAIRRFFASRLYQNLEHARFVIRRIGHEQHSWETVGTITKDVYRELAAATNGHSQALSKDA